VGAKLFHSDGGGGHTDMTKLIASFGNFAKAPKISSTFDREYFRE